MNVVPRLLSGFLLCLSALCAAQPALANVVVGEGCSPLGTSTMATDQMNIVTCLKNDSGALVWKSMTSSSSEFVIAESAWAGSRPNITVACPTGYTVIGGTCSWLDSDGDWSNAQSNPNGNGWQCSSGDATRSAKAYAFCAKSS